MGTERQVEKAHKLVLPVGFLGPPEIRSRREHLAELRQHRGSSSLNGDQTQAPCIGRLES